jgi:hypothetical protein
MKENIERMLRWLEADYDLRQRKGSKKAWLTKAIGISGHNQTKGAIQTLKFILKEWEHHE